MIVRRSLGLVTLAMMVLFIGTTMATAAPSVYPEPTPPTLPVEPIAPILPIAPIAPPTVPVEPIAPPTIPVEPPAIPRPQPLPTIFVT